MLTRKIVGFNDEIEFLVVNDQIQVIDNGSLYKNKLRNFRISSTEIQDSFIVSEFSRRLTKKIPGRLNIKQKSNLLIPEYVIHFYIF